MVRGLLTTDDFTFEGRYYSTARATLHPRPVQSPHPPIWIGASGERRMMPIAARYADVWHSYGPPEMMREKSARLSRMALEIGRDPVEITRASSLSLEDDPDTIARRRRVDRRRVRLPRVRLAGRRRPRRHQDPRGVLRPARGGGLARRLPGALEDAGLAQLGTTIWCPITNAVSTRSDGDSPCRATGSPPQDAQHNVRSWRSASAAAAFAARHRVAPELEQPGDPLRVAQQERDRGAGVRRAVGVREVEHRRVGMIRRQVADHPHRAPRHAARRRTPRRPPTSPCRARARPRRRARRRGPGRRGTRRSSTPRRRASPPSGVASYRVPLLRSIDGRGPEHLADARCRRCHRRSRRRARGRRSKHRGARVVAVGREREPHARPASRPRRPPPTRPRVHRRRRLGTRAAPSPSPRGRARSAWGRAPRPAARFRPSPAASRIRTRRARPPRHHWTARPPAGRPWRDGVSAGVVARRARARPSPPVGPTAGRGVDHDHDPTRAPRDRHRPRGHRRDRARLRPGHRARRRRLDPLGHLGARATPPSTGTIVDKVMPAIPPEWAAQGYNHVGDVDVVGTRSTCRSSSPTTSAASRRWPATTRSRCASSTRRPVHQHHNSFVAVDGKRDIAVLHRLVRRRRAAPVRPRPRLEAAAAAAAPPDARAHPGWRGRWRPVLRLDRRRPQRRVRRRPAHRRGPVPRLDRPRRRRGRGHRVHRARRGRTGAELHTVTADVRIVPVYVDHWTIER